MCKKEVKVTLFGGCDYGEPLATQVRLTEFRDKLMATLGLDEQRVDTFFHIRNSELYNHSIVAGSERRSRVYIAIHEEKNTYPTRYYIVKDTEVCQEWKRNLLTKALSPCKPASPPP